MANRYGTDRSYANGSSEIFEIDLGNGNCKCGNPLAGRGSRFCSRCDKKNNRRHADKSDKKYADRWN